MTSPRTWGVAAAAATVLTLSLVAEGCTWGGGDGGARSAPPTPSAPSATGTGPYVTPSAPSANASALPKAESTGAPRVRTVRPEEVDRTDADAVSRGALTTLWTFDTTTDRGPHSAEVRAADAGWLTGAYAEQLRMRQPHPVLSAQWQEWAGHHARTTVVPERTPDAAQPPDTDTEAWRQWTVTATPSGRDRWSGTPVVVAVFVRLTRTAEDQPWRVSDVIVR
jgi:hypothetical protein